MEEKADEPGENSVGPGMRRSNSRMKRFQGGSELASQLQRVPARAVLFQQLVYASKNLRCVGLTSLEGISGRQIYPLRTPRLPLLHSAYPCTASGSLLRGSIKGARPEHDRKFMTR